MPLHNPPLTTRGATFVIAAADAEHIADADYICDGVADNVQIQQAIDALPASGGSIYLSDGTFTLAAGLTARMNGFTIRGAGIGVTIINFPGVEGYALEVGAEHADAEAGSRYYDAEIASISFQGNGEDDENHLLKCVGLARFNVGKCSFYKSGDEALIIDFCEDWTVSGCIFNDVSGADAAGGGIYLESTSKRGTIHGCHFMASVARTYISLRQITVESVRGIIVHGCSFLGGKTAIDISATTGAGALIRGVAVTGNYLVSQTTRGIDVLGTAPADIEGVLMSNNTFESMPEGIRVSTRTSGIVVEGNYFRSVATPVNNTGQRTTQVNNAGYLAQGEIRTVTGSLDDGAANAFAFAWQNIEAQEIIVTRVLIDITTAGGTANSVLDVGGAPDSTTHSADLIDGIDLDAVDIYDNLGDGGVTGNNQIKLDATGGVTDWITGQILVADALNLVGKYYIEYRAA